MEVAPMEPAVKPSPAETLISISGLGKVYRTKKSEFTALKDIHLEIGNHEFLTLIGPSGCGKSTLLRILAGLEEATEGTVLIDGRPSDGPGADRGMVFQSYTLFPWLTVRQNIEYGLKLKGVPLLERRRVSEFYLRMIRLERFAAAYPKQLSGGMKQRVAIAREIGRTACRARAERPEEGWTRQ